MAFNPTFRIKLLDVLESAYDSAPLKDKLREFITDTEFKQLFGYRVVDRIVNRTRDENIDKKGNSLGVYSKSYKESLIFSIYKGGESSVNLTLTGEMLESLSPKMGRYEIIVELEGQNNRDKAQGHITGRYGKKGRAEKRDFLGLPKEELIEQFKEAMKDFRSGALQELETVPDAA